MSERVQVQTQSGVGMIWVAAWLFTIGYLDLTFWRGVLALLLWPHYLGAALGSVPGGS